MISGVEFSWEGVLIVQSRQSAGIGRLKICCRRTHKVNVIGSLYFYPRRHVYKVEGWDVSGLPRSLWYQSSPRANMRPASTIMSQSLGEDAFLHNWKKSEPGDSFTATCDDFKFYCPGFWLYQPFCWRKYLSLLSWFWKSLLQPKIEINALTRDDPFFSFLRKLSSSSLRIYIYIPNTHRNSFCLEKALVCVKMLPKTKNKFNNISGSLFSNQKCTLEHLIKSHVLFKAL